MTNRHSSNRHLRIKLCPQASQWLQQEKELTGKTATYIINQLVLAHTHTDDAHSDARGNTHEPANLHES